MSKELKMLREQLSKLLNWNKARMTFLAGMLLALLKEKTVNLSELAKAFMSEVEEKSRYRRIQRFLRDYEMNGEEIAVLIKQLIGKQGKEVLILDRTEWRFGKAVINILLLAVQYEGVAVPFFWRVLDRTGISTMEMRIELIEKYVKLFGGENIAYVTGDREFIGGEWISYLQEQGIDFRFRIKKDARIVHEGNLINIQERLEHVNVGQSLYLENCEIYGCQVNLSAVKLKDDEYLLLIGNDNPEKFASDYKQRWDIEQLFACLKSRGFNFEDTHLTDPLKISKMMVLLTIAFLWALKTGLWLHKVKPIPKKKTLNRPLNSLFRYGLDKLHDVLLNIHWRKENFSFFEIALEFLSCT